MNKKYSLSTPITFEKAKEKNILDFPYIAEPLLGGIKCYIRKENDKILLLNSKHEEIITCSHVLDTKTVKNFFIKYPEGVLEGELYSIKKKDGLNKLIKSKTLSDDDKKILKDNVNFHCFDIFVPGKEELTCLGRKNLLIDIIANMSDIDDKDDDFYIGGLMIIGGKFKFYSIESEEEIHLLSAKYKKEGYSGIILKKDTSLIKGKKTKAIKVSF